MDLPLAPRRGRAFAMLLCLVVTTLGPVRPAAGQDVEGFEMADVVETAEPRIEFTLAELLPESQIFHPDVLAQVMPSSARIDQLRADLTVAMIDAADAQTRKLDATIRRSDAHVESWSQRVVVDQRTDREGATIVDAGEAFDQLGAFAIDDFLRSEEVGLARLTVDGAMSSLPGLSDGVADVVEERHIAARAALSLARQARIESESAAAAIAERIEVAAADFERASLDLVDADARIADLRPQLEAALSGQFVPGTDLPIVVIDAYFRAEVSMSERRPTCGISWDQLAGVGLIESRHGAYGGSSVGPNGQTTRQILGPVLDGDPFSAIPDTDGGALDGNTEWDRAVGPMQFIPSSWSIYGLDGNADGVVDPHNLYDAAYAAAEHLCRGHTGLQNDTSYRSALLGYNRSAVYGSDVMAARRGYASAVRLRPTVEGRAEDLARRNGGSAASVAGR